MSELVSVFILAVVQGVTEFLPVSSSGHLSLGHAFVEIEGAPLLLDIVLHVGTLAAVVFFYRKKLSQLILSLVFALKTLPRRGLRAVIKEDSGVRLTLFLILATVLTAGVGLLLKDAVEDSLRSPLWVGAMLLLNGSILWTSKYRLGAPGADLGYKSSAAIGLIQGIAVIPGLSRSGLTITSALHLGIDGEEAAEFSFLLSIPAILGALVLELGDVDASSAPSLWLLLFGALISAVVGLLCLKLLVYIIARMRLHVFAFYCWILGAAAIAYSLA